MNGFEGNNYTLYMKNKAETAYFLFFIIIAFINKPVILELKRKEKHI